MLYYQLYIPFVVGELCLISSTLLQEDGEVIVVFVVVEAVANPNIGVGVTCKKVKATKFTSNIKLLWLCFGCITLESNWS